MANQGIGVPVARDSQSKLDKTQLPTIHSSPNGHLQANLAAVPAIITAAGDRTARRFLEFFTANIRNPNTRAAYGSAVARFLFWCERRGVQFADIEPVLVASYIEELGQTNSKPTVKQHLAAIRMLFDWLVTGGCLQWNPASSVRGPKHVMKRGKTPVLDTDQARQLLESIDINSIVGLRDRALIGLMVYSFARVDAAVSMRVEDYYQDGKRWSFRLHEKGGKLHVIPAHHKAEEYVDAYLDAAGIRGEKKSAIFRTVDRGKQLTARQLTRIDAFRMIRRRARQARLPDGLCCHTFRATGITAYLENGGTIENAQAIANHESPRTTMLYDRTSDEITLNEVERIRL